MYSRDPYRSQPAPSRNPWFILGPILFLGVLAIVVLALSGAFKGGRNSVALNDPEAKPRDVAPRGERNPDERARIKLFKNIRDSVVNVDTIMIQQDSVDLGVIERREGTGSGFVWDKQGHIVTNFHVIMSALQKGKNLAVRVILADRSSHDAILVGASPDHDLAVLRITVDADKLTPIPVGTSGDLEVGQTVYAIGNPFGQSLTLTQGIISALDREIDSITDKPITGVIQTDAAMNPGNSGGPLLDKDGRLIGVNTAITSPSGGSVGIGYSIPVDTVNSIVPELIRSGRTLRPILGVVALPDKYRRNFSIDKGVILQEVRAKGPAEKAGLKGFTILPNGEKKMGDVLLSIKGEAINVFTDLDRILSKCKVQEKVKVTFLRNGQVEETEVILAGI